MKIVHLGSVPVPDDIRSKQVKQHPGRWVLNHALAQKAAGIDVSIISQAHKATCDFDCEIEGIPVHFLRSFHPYRQFTFYALDAWRMARLVRILAPTVVHAHGTEAAYGHAAIRSGLPFCITAQGLFFQILPALGRAPTWNERFLRWGEDMVLRKTRFVVAKSEYVKEALARQYPHLDLTLIPNTYEPRLDGPLVPRSGHAVAYVGTMDERKGVKYLVDALRNVIRVIPDLQLHVMGNPSENNAQGAAGRCLRDLRLVLGDSLFLHGRVSSRELFSILDHCRVIVAPSLEEMFGNQLIEGLMRGCHGVVAEGTALAENARRFGNATVVPQRDAAAIARVLISVFAESYNMSVAEEARSRIRSYMSPSVVAAAHFRFYERIFRHV